MVLLPRDEVGNVLGSLARSGELDLLIFMGTFQHEMVCALKDVSSFSGLISTVVMSKSPTKAPADLAEVLQLTREVQKAG